MYDPCQLDGEVLLQYHEAGAPKEAIQMLRNGSPKRRSLGEDLADKR